MPDIRPRPSLDRPAANGKHQFSLAMNITFQFWDPTRQRPENHPPDITDHWWFQQEEPETPAGWTPDKRGWRHASDGVRSRILYHRDESRRLTAEQMVALGVHW